jgi:hypothetical protein
MIAHVSGRGSVESTSFTAELAERTEKGGFLPLSGLCVLGG